MERKKEKVREKMKENEKKEKGTKHKRDRFSSPCKKKQKKEKKSKKWVCRSYQSSLEKKTKSKNQSRNDSTSGEPDRLTESSEAKNPTLTLRLKLEDAMKKREKNVEENKEKVKSTKKDDLFLPDKPTSNDKEDDPRYGYLKNKSKTKTHTNIS